MSLTRIEQTELEQYGRQWACNVLQTLIDETCHNCSGKDVREAIMMKKESIEREIQRIDGNR